MKDEEKNTTKCIVKQEIEKEAFLYVLFNFSMLEYIQFEHL